MPRTSRKVAAADTKLNSVHPQMQNDERTYKTAVYARLSSEDSGRADGGTIENQILLVRKYIETKPYLRLCETFADNGQTGTNFDREGFQRLMESVKCGKIDCIVVKDLSRFGRDYIETGDYLEKILPFLGARFISVNDGYDSHDPAKSGDILTIALKNLINDLYAKDISRKVRSAFEVKKLKGEYIGNVAPYGYLKSPVNKNKFIINEETAPTVRDIFQWKLEGFSNTVIMRKLNEASIASPSNYLYSKGLLSNERFSKKILWNVHCVKNILTNIAYIGHTAQGKTKSDLSLGIKQKINTKEDWIIVENTHEPIIEHEIFQTVQNIINERTKEYKLKQNKSRNFPVEDNIFSGLVCCAGCGKNLVRQKFLSSKEKVLTRFVCPAYILHFFESCKKKTMSEKNLREMVFTAMKQQIILLSKAESEVKQTDASPKIKNQGQDLIKEKQTIEQRINKLKSLRGSLYDDFNDNLITEKEYNYTRQKYETENTGLTSRLEELSELSAELEKYADNYTADTPCSSEMQRFNHAGGLSREMLTALVEKIIIYDKDNIEVVFKYQDEFARVKKYEAKAAVEKAFLTPDEISENRNAICV